jgi:hypothetical protein
VWHKWELRRTIEIPLRCLYHLCYLFDEGGAGTEVPPFDFNGLDAPEAPILGPIFQVENPRIIRRQ